MLEKEKVSLDLFNYMNADDETSETFGNVEETPRRALSVDEDEVDNDEEETTADAEGEATTVAGNPEDVGEGTEEHQEDNKYPVIAAEPSLHEVVHKSAGNKREIGLLEQGCIWTLSSAKTGNGVNSLRDGRLDTYWQSDGTQPHTISVQFLKRATVSHICLYLDYNLDESYTPREIMVKAGMTNHDVEECIRINVVEPVGWIIIDCKQCNNEEDYDRYVRAHLIQIRITAMHQNGRDTHIRLVKLFGPRSKHPRVIATSKIDQGKASSSDFFDEWDVSSKLHVTTAMSQYDTIR